jgi:hypothetical protein
MWFSPAEKKILELDSACEAIFPGVNTSAAANASSTSSIDVRVYLSDFNMELLPIANIISSVAPTAGGWADRRLDAPRCTITTAVEAVYKMGKTPGYCDESDVNATGEHFCYPAHFIENIPSAIAGPSEWAVDTSAGLVYYWPSSTDDAGSPMLDAVWAGSSSELIRVEGWEAPDSSDPVANYSLAQFVSFEGITFRFGDLNMPSADDMGGTQHDYAQVDKANALLRLRMTSDVSIHNCTFEHSGGGGVRMDLDAMHNSITDSTFRYLGLEAISIAGYGAGRMDKSQHNQILRNHIHHIGQAKDDAPAVSLWHTAFNTAAHNYIHDTPSKAFYIGGSRDRSFTPQTSMRGQAWKMMRWGEIPINVTEIVVDPAKGDKGIEPPNIPDDDFAADHKCGPYRYTRGNQIANNTLRLIAAWRDRKFFGDGVIYISGTADGAPQSITGNLFVEIGNLNGADINQLIYTDGYGGQVEIHGNAMARAHNAKFMLTTWYGNSSATANVWSQSCCRDSISADTTRWAISGNMIVTDKQNERTAKEAEKEYSETRSGSIEDGRNTGTHSSSGVTLLNSSMLHDPDPKFLSQYISMYLRLCNLSALGSPSPPAQLLPGVPQLRAGLLKEIEALGGTAPSAQCT